MNYYNEIKNELINNEVYKRAKDYSRNRSDLNTYYNVGKLLAEAGKHYGEGIIKNYSIRLTNEINKKYNTTNLKRMRQFYWLIEKGAPLAHHLSWSHYVELLPIRKIQEISYYIELCKQQNLSRNELRNRIKSREYERLPIETKNKLIEHNDVKVDDFIKNPIIIRNKNNMDITKLSEKYLKLLILEDLNNFIKELGNGFCYIDHEYKIKLGDRYNYIDLLLFNYIYNCFIVIELKITELRKEHIGQIETYINYIDKNVKTISQDKTMGIIICRKNNKFVMAYCSDERVLSREYELI